MITKIACFHTRIIQRAASSLVLSQKLTFARVASPTNHSLIHSLQPRCIYTRHSAPKKNASILILAHLFRLKIVVAKFLPIVFRERESAPSNIGSCTSVCKRYTLLCALRTLHSAGTTLHLGRSNFLSPKQATQNHSF